MSKFHVSALTAILMIGLVSSSPAVEAVRVELSVYQQDTVAYRDVLLNADTVDCVVGLEVSGFMTGLSLDLKVTEFDSVQAALTVHAHTFALQPGNYAQRFRVEYGLPARMDELIGKNGAEYSLRLTPLEAVDVDTSWCGQSHRRVEDFGVDASTHVDIYYVENTLGDFYWNSVKGLMEEEYKTISGMVNFNMPGKQMLFLCPCRIHTIIWDDRFGMMVDPLRSTMFSIYQHGFNSTYPFLITQAYMFHNYGYTPAFLSEGFANYTSLAVYDLRKLWKAGRAIPLDSLFDTYYYLQADPETADRTAAAFVRYLVDAYKIDSFLELYRAGDDLNLRESIEEVYGKPLADLENEWKQYVDTLTVPINAFAQHVVKAETMLDYGRMAEYATELVHRAAGQRDKLEALSQLSRAQFFSGDYESSIETQNERLALDENDAREWMKLAAYQMIVGSYDDASESLDRAQTLDSVSSIIRFNRALNYLYRADTAAARSIFEEIVEAGEGGGEVESRVMLALLLQRAGKSSDHDEALNQYNYVINALSRMERRHNPSSSQALWLGISYLGIEDTDMAEQMLNTARFLETRPFYQGMIELWLGKTADVRGDRETATQFYEQVMASRSAEYHRQEARAYLRSPYQP